jgi:hypothetical protein
MSELTQLPLRPDEVDLVGQWLAIDGAVVADPITRRIEALVARALNRVAVTDGGWSTLYRDPRDGRYWEHTYPQSWMHGGGPPRLTFLTKDDVAARYGL